MIAVEVQKLAMRLRTWILIAALCAVGSIFMFGTHSGGGPRGDNPALILGRLKLGSVMPFLLLYVFSIFFLPLTVAVVSGDAFGGEVASGTLRYLLVRPVRRTRLYVAKLAAAGVFGVAATIAVVIVGVTLGAALFGGIAPRLVPAAVNRFSLGVTTGYVQWVARLLLAAGYVSLLLLAFAAIGVFASMLIQSSNGAAGIVLGALIAMSILEGLDALSWLRPGLLTHWMTEWTVVLQTPLRWAPLAKGAACAAGYIAVFTGFGVTLFQRRDVLV